MRVAVYSAGLALLVSAPASAESFATLWSLKDITTALPVSAELEKPFFEQRIVPLRLVRLDQDVTTATGKSVGKGSLLYLIVDKTNRQAFCTFKDNSTKNAAKSLFIPGLDKRPCFIDDDRDGRFEKSFSVFEAWGTVAPEPIGNIRKSTPIAPSAYSEADPLEAPTDYRLTLHVFKRGKPPYPELRFLLGGKNDSVMQSEPGVREGEAVVAVPFNYSVRLKLETAASAAVTMTKTDQDVLFVRGDVYVMLKPEEYANFKSGSR